MLGGQDTDEAMAPSPSSVAESREEKEDLGVTNQNTPDPLYFTVWPCIKSTRLLVLVSVESVHLPFLEVQFGYQLIPNLQKRQMDREAKISFTGLFHAPQLVLASRSCPL